MPNKGNTVIWSKPQPVVPRKIVTPKPPNVPMRCGNCGRHEFHIHVLPTRDGSAGVREVVCTTCAKFYKLTSDGMIAGGGYLTNNETGEKIDV